MSNMHFSLLGDLANPNKYNKKVDISSIDSNTLTNYLSSMLTIRFAEQAIARLVQDGHAKCPCHLAVGQEAIPTGVSASLNCKDYIFGNHRSHGHYLALGSSLDKLIAEVLGKATGCSSGMGGSMHLTSEDTGFIGSVPIVAGTISIAVGAAFAAKMDGKDQIAVSYFGDGATEEGGFHEALNLAVVYNLPILFVCENNLHSSHLDIALRQPCDTLARYAEAHCIHGEVIDGNDVVEVAKRAKHLISGIRAGKGPAFLEAVTYRWLGHVGPDENIDVGVRRSIEVLTAWKQRDPIKRLKDAMLDVGIVSSKDIISLGKEIIDRVDSAVWAAMEAPYPSEDALLNSVYAGVN